LFYNFRIQSFSSSVSKFWTNGGQTQLNVVRLATSRRSSAPGAPMRLSVRPHVDLCIPRSPRFPWPHAARAHAWEPALPLRVVHAARPRRPPAGAPHACRDRVPPLPRLLCTEALHALLHSLPYRTVPLPSTREHAVLHRAPLKPSPPSSLSHSLPAPPITPSFSPRIHSSLLSRLLLGTGHDLAGAELPAAAAAWVRCPSPPTAAPPQLWPQTES
jgi:hypothetical protein